MPVLRRCLACGELTAQRHAHASPGRIASAAVHQSARWRRLSARLVRQWIGEHGPWCPGWHVPRHVSYDLTADHLVPVAEGGAPFDERNVSILCRSCNGRKGRALA